MSAKEVLAALAVAAPDRALADIAGTALEHRMLDGHGAPVVEPTAEVLHGPHPVSLATKLDCDVRSCNLYLSYRLADIFSDICLMNQHYGGTIIAQGRSLPVQTGLRMRHLTTVAFFTAACRNPLSLACKYSDDDTGISG